MVEELIVVEAGISGASRHNRPGLLGLLERVAEWDVLLCWDSTRLARDSEDLGWVRNRLRAHRRTGYEVSSGLDLFNVGAKVLGIIGEEYLVKLRADTHRGLRGRAERGLAAGGRPYGYRSDPILTGRVDSHGQPVPEGYRLVLDPETAAVVRRIFEDYAAGEGLRAITHRLNAEGVRPPRPRALHAKRPSWTVSSIQALLGNPIYKGDSIWNRSEWVKDHETGRRRRFERPESEWVRHHDEGWRIVADEVWERVAARRRESRDRSADPFPRRQDGALLGGYRGQRSNRRRALLAGLLECGTCGGSFFAITRNTTYGCGWHRDRGPEVCSSTLRVDRQALESRVVGALYEQILDAEVLLRAAARATEKLRDELLGRADDLAADKARLAELDEEVARATRLAVKAGPIDEVAVVLAELEAERQALRIRIGSAGGPAIDMGALRECMVAYVTDLRASFESAPEAGRRVFETLLAGRRIQVLEDAARGFRVEGVFELAPGGRQSARLLGEGDRASLAGRSGGRI